MRNALDGRRLQLLIDGATSEKIKVKSPEMGGGGNKMEVAQTGPMNCTECYIFWPDYVIITYYGIMDLKGP